MPAKEPKSRRDALVISAACFMGVGALAAIWPLLSHLGPNAGSEVPFLDVDVSDVAPQVFKSVALAGRPLWLRRWSRDDAWLVTSAACSRCGCVLKVHEIPIVPTAPTLICPCCASLYDFAGKRIGVSTLPDLETVPLKQLSNRLLRIGRT